MFANFLGFISIKWNTVWCREMLESIFRITNVHYCSFLCFHHHFETWFRGLVLSKHSCILAKNAHFWSLKTSVGCRTPQLSSKMFLTCSATSNWVVTTRVYIERLNFRSLLWFWKRGSILSLLSLFKVHSPSPSFQSHMWEAWVSK